MYRVLQTGRTSLNAMQKKMDTISNNIANVQTTGYKSIEVQFEDLVYDQLANRGVPQTQTARENFLSMGTGSKVKSTQRRFQQGELNETQNSYHFAIEGQGFFGVQNENGEIFLTRDGGFSLDVNGQLVDNKGNQVMIEGNGNLGQWAEEDISIDENGCIIVNDGGGQRQEVGRILLFDVPDKGVLLSRGDNYFSIENVETLYDNINTQNDFGKIHQGFLEGSSVDIGEELVQMLVTQRAYQINTKSIHAADEMWSMINQLRR